MAFIPYNGVNYVPNIATPSDMVREQIVVKRKNPLDVLMEEIQHAQSALPSSKRRPMSFFLPEDAENNAPSKTDPRQDDGSAPSAPANVRLASVSASASNVTFNPSPEADVVGYRLYRSDRPGAPFKKIGDSILVGEKTVFSTATPAGAAFTYYVTAVDVVGHESAPSRSVGGSSGPSDPVTPPTTPDLGSGVPTPGTKPGGSTDNTGGTSGGTSTGNSNSGGTPTEPETPEGSIPLPSAPTGLAVEATDMGVRITWSSNAVSDQVTKYNVYYSANNDGKYVRLGSTSETRFEYVSVMTGGAYQVTAINDRGESSSSASLIYGG